MDQFETSSSEPNSSVININLNPDITSSSSSPSPSPSTSSSSSIHRNNTDSNSNNNISTLTSVNSTTSSVSATANPSRYESQKRRDWHTFGQYLRNHRPPLSLPQCSGAHVLEFLRYLDQFGKTKVHGDACPFFGHPSPPGPCPCPLKQAWGSLDALIGRLRAAFEENGGAPEANPFGARAVRIYLREVRDSQSKARGVSYEKKKRKRPAPSQQQQRQSSLGSAGAVTLASSVPATTILLLPPPG